MKRGYAFSVGAQGWDGTHVGQHPHLPTMAFHVKTRLSCFKKINCNSFTLINEDDKYYFNSLDM